jgi:hypothetical protein
MLDGQHLIPAELIAELAKTAKLRPLIIPLGAEPGYAPSAKLAAFVRCWDLTCRAPGCDRPATHCDLDPTIPTPTQVPRMRRTSSACAVFIILIEPFDARSRGAARS